MKQLFLLLIRFYQAVISPYILSPFFSNSCRFAPTCSEYARQAVEKYGGLKGGWMSLKRISKCHPFHPGGYDPVR